MLQLNIEQIEGLMQLQARRDAALLADVLSRAFVEPAQRLGDRLPALIALAVERGQAQGLRHALALGRYLATWFVLGAEFETRPGFEWARQLLQDPARSEGARIYQLCGRVREHLSALPATAVGGGPALVTQFEQALPLLDSALQDHGAFGALARGPRLVLGQACDIDRVGVRLEQGERQNYRHEHGTWTRGRSSEGVASLRVSPGDDQPLAGAVVRTRWPEQLWLLAPAGQGRPALLRLRCVAEHCCDERTHPLVRWRGPTHFQEWRGGLAADPQIEAYAAPAPPRPDGLPVGLVAPAPAASGRLALSACGLREQGAVWGECDADVRILPVEQHLMLWRRSPLAPLAWTEQDALSPALPSTRLRLERDGQLLDPGGWQRGWDALDQQLLAALALVFGSWRRDNGLEHCALQATPAALVGEAGVTWGWADAAEPLVAPPRFRVALHLALQAVQLGLRLTGEINVLGARARLQLSCQAVVPLQATAERLLAEAGAWPDDLPLSVAFGLPLVLQAEALATDNGRLLHAGPAQGGFVGACGLRRRADGSGWQWFFQLALEPVVVRLRVESPATGRTEITRALLPAMPLVDWSLG